ncbi:hypothetical protein ACHAXR_003910 [Thalassiosira sp. AJA248-18]
MTDIPANSSTTKDCNDAANLPSTEKGEERYDVIICGTDLIQSILSSALSRAGKKVLHCDGNEWYGGLDAVLYGGSTLDLFIEGCEQLVGTMMQGEDGMAKNGKEGTKEDDALQLLPRDKCGNLRLHSQTFIGAAKDSSVDAPTKNVNITLSDTGLQKLSIEDKKGKEDISNENEDANNDCVTENASIMNETASTLQPTTNPLEHGFCFDLTPSLLYASGDAVEGLVKSGVADYLEFKSLRGLYLLMEEEKSSTTRGGRRSRNTGKSRSNGHGSENDGESGVSANDRKLASYRVPCSKGDVFRSKLLSPVDKRRLMKFLQLITDYGMTTQLGEGQTPINAPDDASDEAETGATVEDSDNTKTDPDAVSGEDAIQSVNERHLHQGRALSRPQNKATPSSSEMEGLMRCIRDDVSFSDFLTNVVKLPERLSTVVIHALALAPFGYSTKDGVDDLVRHVTALGRFGDTAFLTPMYGSGELSQAFCRSGAVYGSTYMLRRSPMAISLDEDACVKGVVLSGEEHIGGNDDVDTDDVSDSQLSCKDVIVPSTMMVSSNGNEALQARTYRRISILQGKLMIDQDQNDNKDSSDHEQRYAIVIPPGTHGLENKSAIHCVAVDDSAFVAPHEKNYTVLHLTTNRQTGDGTEDDLFVGALSKAVEFLIASRPTTKDEDAPIEECHHISYSYSSADMPSFNEEDGKNSGQPSGLHVCYRDKQSLTCDSAFKEAKRIFEEICPDSDFLALAKKVEDKIVYRDEHDSDDEKMVLESACTMIQAPATEDKPLQENDTVESSNNDV